VTFTGPQRVLARRRDNRQNVGMGPLFTVGHSTRSLDELVRLCEGGGVRAVADVRRFPGSRRSPHFARQALEESLPAHGIDYLWLPALGGHRRRASGAPPSPWQVAAFAAYADHMRGAEFHAGIEALLASLADRATAIKMGTLKGFPSPPAMLRGEQSSPAPLAIMCAEASPYRCHRRLISDWAELHGIEVVHLIDEGRSERHHVTAFARRDGDDVVYEVSPQLDLPIG